MIDLETETLILPADVCRMFPGRKGKGISRSTVWRWMLRGRRGHKLESLIIGGQRYTTREAVCRFVAACNHGRNGQSVRTQRYEDRRAQLVERELQAEGF